MQFFFLLSIFLVINISPTISFFNSIKVALGIRNNNNNERIVLTIPPKHKKFIKQIKGFYGLIGPNIYMDNSIDSLYDLFMGDGVVQGIFFDNGNLTYVKHLIKTEKILYEEKFGKLPINNNFLMFIFIFLNKLSLFPNVLGMANTAILNVKNGIDNKVSNNYALFERDYPYLLDIDFDNKDINTIKKVTINSLSHFSGHSKIDTNGNIETIDYNIFNNNVKYLLLDKNFKLIDNYIFKFKNLPIIHDFYSSNDFVVLIDSPLLLDFTQDIQNKMPLYLNNKKRTFIYIYDKKTKKYETYSYEEGFYTFHYAYIKNYKNTIEIYISQYDDLNFTNINIIGKYRMIEINKNTKSVFVHKNKELECYNVDFPICFNDKVILRHYENRKINGFIVTKGLKIIKKIFFDNKNICGEHNILYIKKTPYLIFFNIEHNKNKKINKNLITLMNLNNYEFIDIEIQNNLTLGFHSIFLPFQVKKE
jgi:hypothetical protein